jgi:uncharacterized protein YndB with AHSA1/START domain
MAIPSTQPVFSLARDCQVLAGENSILFLSVGIEYDQLSSWGIANNGSFLLVVKFNCFLHFQTQQVKSVMFIVQRVLSTLLILLLIAAAALWIMGGAKKENDTSLEFDATPEQIWPYLTEPDRIRQWFSGLVSIDPIEAPSDDPAAPAPAPIRRVLQTADGDRVEYKDQILRFTPGQMLSLRSRSSGGTLTWVYQLEAMVDDRANVTFRVVQSASGLARLLAPLTEDVSLKQIEIDIRQLKQVVEAAASSNSQFGLE